MTQEVIAMETIVGCDIQMEFREIGPLTEAVVRLRMHDGTEMLAQGRANRNPEDPSQPRVGEEIAAARALTNLAHRLIGKAGGDIEEVTHSKAHLLI
ncbi:DUF1876 domain-containing protein [Stenotrophomonas sp. NPDC087984]